MSWDHAVIRRSALHDLSKVCKGYWESEIGILSHSHGSVVFGGESLPIPEHRINLLTLGTLRCDTLRWMDYACIPLRDWQFM